MKKWYYSILELAIKTVTGLPLVVLYLIGDFAFVIMYYIVGYRRKIVRQNLQNAFPDKSREELTSIEKKYYRHMIDVMIETLKLATISKSELIKRNRFHNVYIIDELMEKNQSFIFVLGHMGNWEWAGSAFAAQHPAKVYALYHPLSNQFFNWYMHKLRSRFGGGLIAMNNVLREMVKHRSEFCGFAFISDQTPSNENSMWTEFLNQETLVFTGTEKIAKRFNYPVVFSSVAKPKRGYYENTFHLLTLTPGATIEGEITKQHIRLLEDNIKKTPWIWLWSHRRWKHKRKG